jgi:hypothetical protein
MESRGVCRHQPFAQAIIKGLPVCFTRQEATWELGEQDRRIR